MANVIYENFILQDKYNSVLSTALNMNQFMTVDTSLTAEDGMTIKVNTRTVSGSAEDVEMGAGNTGSVEVSTATVPYEVITTQARAIYHDEEVQTDSKAIDNLLTGLSEVMVNDYTAKAIAEFEKANQTVDYANAIDFNAVVDALGYFPEREEGLFMLMGPDSLAAFRKGLKDDLKYVEDFARKGYIGSVCGVPVYVSKAVPAGKAFVANKSAITLFVKKDATIEQERDANTRKNTVYARRVGLVALTDASKVVMIKKA